MCDDVPWDVVVNVTVFKGPYVLIELVEFLSFFVAKRGSVISMSTLKLLFCKSNVRLSCVIVPTFYSCLVDDESLKAVSVKLAVVFFYLTVE